MSRLRVLIETDGKTVVDIDREVADFTVHLTRGFISDWNEDGTTNHQPDGAHQLTIDYRIPLEDPS